MTKISRSLSMLALGLGALSSVLCSAQTHRNPGAVFVMTNDADRNEVIAYQRAADGTLSASIRYKTGGRGSGGVTDPLESQGALTLSQDHSLLFAANAGSGNISVFAIGRGRLFLVAKVPSGGSQPVAVAEHGNLVYVLNSGGAGNVTVFHLDFGGQLRQVPNSTVFLTGNSTGGASIAVSPNGRFLAVTERLSNTIDTFAIRSDGTLGPLVANPDPAPGTFSLAFAPSGFAIVSETGVAGATDGSAVSSYRILNNGKIAAVTHSIPAFAAANCWNAITPDGKHVYTSNAGSDSIAGYAIAPNGTLTPIGKTVVGNNPEGSTNLDIAISADGQFLYTLNSGAGNIGTFRIAKDGSLTSLGQAANLPRMAGFNGIAAL